MENTIKTIFNITDYQAMQIIQKQHPLYHFQYATTPPSQQPSKTPMIFLNMFTVKQFQIYFMPKSYATYNWHNYFYLPTLTIISHIDFYSDQATIMFFIKHPSFFSTKKFLQNLLFQYLFVQIPMQHPIILQLIPLSSNSIYHL